MDPTPATITTCASSQINESDVVAMFRSDPNFMRLPLPDSFRKRHGIPLLATELSMKDATTRTFCSGNSYTGYELRDASGNIIILD
jgi:hypothetical protein